MYHTSQTAAARKKTRDNGASQRLPSFLRGTSLTPPSSTVSVMRHPETQLELAEAIGAGDRATAPFAARTDPRVVRWPAPPTGQKKASGPRARGTMSLVSARPQGRKCRHFGRPCGQVEAPRRQPAYWALSAQAGRPGA